MTGVVRSGLAVALLVQAGCASAYVLGMEDLRGGRWEDASRHFSSALAQQPRRLDARLALGVAQYKLGDWDAAAEALGRVAAEVPRSAEARLYLALTFLQRHEDARALEELAAVRDLKPHPRVAAQVERAIEVIRAGPSEAVRAFVAASLDDQADWARDVVEARRTPRYTLEPTWVLYRERLDWYPHGLYP